MIGEEAVGERIGQRGGIEIGGDDRHDLDAIFSALADPTRRAILGHLQGGEASVTELTEPFEISQPAISRHLKVLERAGLVSRARDGQRRPCRLEAEPLAEAAAWLAAYRRFWDSRFRDLDAVLETLKAREARGESP